MLRSTLVGLLLRFYDPRGPALRLGFTIEETLFLRVPYCKYAIIYPDETPFKLLRHLF